MKLPSILVLLAFSLLFSVPAAQAFDHSHAALDKVLKSYVNRAGMVNYASLKANRAGLDAYLQETAKVSQSEFDGWSEQQQLAFLINLYNAETLQLVIDKYPVSSIKKIGSLFGTPWDVKAVELFGKTTTLNYVEHDLLRKNFNEPRIHFAIVCAAIGCPPLRTEAYTPDKLDAQLTETGKLFFSQSGKNRVEGSTLYLSPIFKWFSEDFTKTGTLQEFVNPYFSEDVTGKKVKYTDYDWSLNKQ